MGWAVPQPHRPDSSNAYRMLGRGDKRDLIVRGSDHLHRRDKIRDCVDYVSQLYSYLFSQIHYDKPACRYDGLLGQFSSALQGVTTEDEIRRHFKQRTRDEWQMTRHKEQRESLWRPQWKRSCSLWRWKCLGLINHTLWYLPSLEAPNVAGTAHRPTLRTSNWNFSLTFGPCRSNCIEKPLQHVFSLTLRWKCHCCMTSWSIAFSPDSSCGSWVDSKIRRLVSKLDGSCRYERTWSSKR